jgi:porin
VADVGDDVESNWGFDWSFRHGATFFGEAAWHGHLADHAGSIRFGALGSTQDIRDLDGAVVADGVWNLYASASQDLWLDADGRPLLAAFLRGGFSPGSAAAAIRWFAQAGAVLAGVVPGRADDAVLLGVAYTSFARDYLADLAAHDERASGRETLLEVSYRAQLTPWLQIEPSLQCFFKPHFSRRNAVAFELTAVITL